jgi:S-(hydroxymethyl)glutathione dehydrogenase/alcohol dehydrogenase
VGENVTEVKPGDPVVASLLKSCRRCFYCLTGRPHLCRGFPPQQPPVKLHDTKGQSFSQVFNVAGFAEYVTVHSSQVIKIPDDMPIDRASLLACGVITGFGAVVNRAGVEALSSVVVVGTGGVGLNSIQGAAFSGAYPVIAVDILDSKLEAAREFGATHTVRADAEDAIKQVQALTSGWGADYVFVTVGSLAAIQQGFLMSGPRGMTVVVGLTKRGETVSLPPLLPSEKVFTSSYMGATNLSTDIPRLVALYQAGRLKLDELITERYPLEKINEAIEAVEAGKALRNVIVF